MRFHADLHVHSKYSRATSRDLDLEHLAFWAARKGIGVVATGDCVHPAWLAEIKEKLIPAQAGLFRLKPDIEAELARRLPPSCRAPVRFMLSTEISTIYKKDGKTRKVHHLIYAPDFATVDRLAARLARIGNIASDGRPILGLDSRDLLEVALESGPDAYLVPAHIWTPWFAALGSQSGFDSIEACYGDLASHIFAVETGLSSDPPMNWRLSFLDGYRLTSNSDAHSPGKLGREATFFDCEPDYFAIRRALETGEGYGGTVEFFPEEGKYHADGHRKCGVRLTPVETRAEGGRCPVCGEPLTIGVLHRVEALADRSEKEAAPPPSAGEVKSLVPLPEIIAELSDAGAAAKRVVESYDQALARLGSELSILEEVPAEDIEHAGSPLLAEAITRLRAGSVIREAGYDGEYGVIRLFAEGELAERRAGALLFDAPIGKRRRGDLSATRKADMVPSSSGARPAGESFRDGETKEPTAVLSESRGTTILAALDPDQRKAASHVFGPLLVTAGPGSGKTRMLTHRIAHLVADHGVPPEACLAVTFTRRAAAEMRDRLLQLLPAEGPNVPIHTFHSLGLAILKEARAAAGQPFDLRIAGERERAALLMEALGLSQAKASRLLRRISAAKRTRSTPTDGLAEAMAVYARAMERRGWLDFDDLVGCAVRSLEADTALAGSCRERYRFISVDEFQDVDEEQYRLLRLIAPANGNLCAVGDPDQAIYGFRGADAAAFDRFLADYSDAARLSLSRNYRSTGSIVAASSQLIAPSGRNGTSAEIVREMRDKVSIHEAASDAAEAEFVVASIEAILGGHSFFSIDSGRARSARGTALSFADFAVLYRTDAQAEALAKALSRSGLPFSRSTHLPISARSEVAAILAELDPRAPLDGALKDAALRLKERNDIDQEALPEALHRLLELAAASGGDRERFGEALSLACEADFLDPRADRISLLTMHAAKGLEFAVVFVVGLEDGIVPLTFGAGAADLAEERRLFYVAMTRAKDRLFLCRAAERLWRGAQRRHAPSPYLADIEAELLSIEQTELPRRRAADAQLALF